MDTQMQATTGVSLTEASIENIPSTMKERPQWVCWRWQEKVNGEGDTKVPVTRWGRPASSVNPATWCTFDEAVEAWRTGTFAGIGYVFSDDDGLVGLDVDDAIIDGKLRQPEATWISTLASYTEISPSGTGVKVIFRGHIPEKVTRRGFGQGNGVYTSGRFFTITGHVYEGYNTIRDVPAAEVAAMAQSWFPEQQRVNQWEEQEERFPDTEVLRLLNSAKNSPKFLSLFHDGDISEYVSQSEADTALISLIAFYTGPVPQQIDRIFCASALWREKWEENRGNQTYGERTIEWVLDHTDEYYSGGANSIGYRGSGERQSMQQGKVATAQERKVGRRLDSIQPERVSWLWPGRIPYGKLTVLDGDPGLGKSTVTMDIAARLTTGQSLPDGSDTEAAGVVLLTAEDGMADTVVPRLMAAGADLSLIIDASTTDDGERLARLNDLAWLEENIKEVAARLVIIDPLMAFLGDKVNSYNDQEIRGALGPLAKLGERTGAAIVVVRHLNKGKGNSAIYRGGGSIGIIGAARSGLLVAKEPNNPEWRVLASVKSNLGPPPASLAYRLESTDNGSSRVVWLGTVNYDADALLAPAEGERPQGEKEKAASFLSTALKDGPAYSSELQARAKGVGIAERTYWRAVEELRLDTWKEAGVQRGRNLTGLPGQRELYLAAVNSATPHPASDITTVAECGISYPNHLKHTSPCGNVGRVKEDTPSVVTVHTLPTLPTLPSGDNGKVEAKAGRRIVHCNNTLTTQEMAAEAEWEGWLNNEYRNHDASTGAWPTLPVH